MSLSISVDTTKLNEIIAKLPGNRDKIVKAIAFEVLREAQQKAPVDTGALKANADVNTKYAGDGIMSVEFYQEYAPYVELGTHNADGSVRMKERPFLKPAVEEGAKKLADMFKGLFK